MSGSRENATDPMTKESYPQLLSLAVHEFRTPVSVVGGYLRMLQRDAADPLTDRQRKMIDEAEKSCARLVAIIAQLSDISKLDAGLIGLARQPLDVFPLMSEVAEHVHDAEDREVHLEVRGEAAGATVLGDAARLRTAFEAILRAILREKPGPCTVVADRHRTTAAGPSSAVIVIAEEADVQAVYDGAPGTFDERRGGLGLELPLARRIIEGHGGRVWSPALVAADDEPRARGSAVISLPLTESKR